MASRSPNKSPPKDHEISNSEIFYDADYKPYENSLINDFSAFEIKSALSKDNKEQSKTSLSRISLYRQFDPLVDTSTLNGDPLIAKASPVYRNVVQNQFSPIKENDRSIQNESTILMNFNTPMVNNCKKLDDQSNNKVDGTHKFSPNDLKANEHLIDCLKNQELFFQEKLLAKEKEIFKLREELDGAAVRIKNYEQTINALSIINQELANLAGTALKDNQTVNNDN